MWVEFH
jgi:hypothetical protein